MNLLKDEEDINRIFSMEQFADVVFDIFILVQKVDLTTLAV